MIGEMSGGQHRDDEVTRTELVGWIGEQQTENCGAALGRKQRGCTTVGVCPKGIKKELNTLDGADFVRDVANRDYHYLSRLQIDGGKRISQYLSGMGFANSFAFKTALTANTLYYVCQSQVPGATLIAHAHLAGKNPCRR
jgi:hypothetical protein